MFDKLQTKWKVKGLSFILILVTFALGGSLTGWLGKKLLGLIINSRGWEYYILYIIIITLLWPLAVLLVSIPLGRFTFFKSYIKRIWHRLRSRQSPARQNSLAHAETKIAIFASGAGSNAQKIIAYFASENFSAASSQQAPKIHVSLLVCNKPDAGAIAVAKAASIPVLLIEKNRFFHGDAYTDVLHKAGIDFIVLAGFLWKIPSLLLQAYPRKIINLHPALLPKYGGKGMYGNRVHETVLACGEKESGITIHYVDDLYDHGEIIFQTSCPVMKNDTPASLAERIRRLEHKHFPNVITQCIAHRKKQ